MLQKMYKCDMSVLSPIHIGAGMDNKYGQYEYINSKAKFNGETVNTIKRINILEYYRSLSEDKKDELLEYLEDSRFKLCQLNDKKVNDFTSYTAINNSTTEVDEIQEHIKTNQKLYVPGSSIKGAINTALIYDKIQSEDMQTIRKLIRKGRNENYIDKRGYNNLINSVFSSKNKKSNNFQQNTF